MTVIDSDTLDLLRTSLRHVLTDRSSEPFAARLEALGWDEVVADDAPTALATLFQLKGETLSAADALGPELGAALATGCDAALPSGTSVALGSPFGASSAGGDSLTVEAMLLAAPGPETPVVIPVGTGDALRLAIVTAGELAIEPLAGIDDTLGAVRATGTVTGGSIDWIEGEQAAAGWAAVTRTGRWLLACELVGIGRHVIAGAVAYTDERVQYGRKIGTFQALQHRLASAHSLVVGAGHLADEAGRAGDGWSATVAKCVAGQAAETACTQAQQCYGAIGFTWEHEFHRYLRRTYVLDRLLGDWRALEHEIGIELQARGRVPHIGGL